MGESELNPTIPKPFDALSAPQKVEAVLIKQEKPITRNYVLELAGVNTDYLKEQEQQELNAIFNGSDVQKSTDERFGERFWIPTEKKEDGYRRLGVDPKSVTKHLSDKMWADLGGDPNSSKLV